jgi:hypothetical protein
MCTGTGVAFLETLIVISKTEIPSGNALSRNVIPRTEKTEDYLGSTSFTTGGVIISSCPNSHRDTIRFR